MIAIPTDTLYGLAAPLEEAEELFRLKGRSPDHPLPILAATMDQILPLLKDPPDSFFVLAEAFWPGGLTLVVPVNVELVPEVVRAGGDSVGFRIPRHPMALKILKEQGPMAVTSANLSGKPPSKTADEVRAYFGADFPVIDGGEAGGDPSTVIAYREGKWHWIRKGAVSEQELRKKIPPDEIAPL